MRNLFFSLVFLLSFSMLEYVSQTQPNSAQSPTKAPVTADEFLQRGLNRVERGNRKGAIEDFTKAIELNPRLAVAYKNRSFQHIDAAAYDLAIADLSKVIELDPKDAIAYMNRGIARQEKGDLDEALADLDTAIRLHEKSIFPYVTRSDVLMQKGQYQSAIYDLNTAIEIDPQDAAAYGNRGLAELALGEDALAEKDFKACFALNPALEVDFNKAANETRKNLAEERKAADETKRAEQIARDHPENFEAQVKAAQANLAAERYNEAIEFLITAHKLRKSDYEVIVSLGRTYYDSGKYAEAEQWLRTALLQKPDDAHVRAGLGAMLVLRKPPDLDGAIKEFRRCLEVDPNEATVLAALAHALLEKGDAREAGVVLARLENVAPANRDLPMLKEKLAALSKQKNPSGAPPPHQ
jgi:tetratricopeptide (TPR) repeat protein